MCRNRRQLNRFRQRGISLVPALFLIIVLASLAAVAVRLTAVQQQTNILAIQGTRAYAAAKAGLEVGIYDALVNSNCGSQTLVLNEAGLNGFSVDINCASSTHQEGPDTTTIYVIDAFAQGGSYGSPDYVSRRMRSKVTDTS